jgi:hypothetical protein
VTQEVNDNLDKAIKIAEDALNVVKTEQEVIDAVNMLNTSVENYNEAKTDGTKKLVTAASELEKLIAKVEVTVADLDEITIKTALLKGLTVTDGYTVEITDYSYSDNKANYKLMVKNTDETDIAISEEVISTKVTVEDQGGDTSISSKYTLTLIGEGLTSDSKSEEFDENTEVTITIVPLQGQEIDTFIVNGADKKAEIEGNKYTFAITEDTKVAITYKDTIDDELIEVNTKVEYEQKLKNALENFEDKLLIKVKDYNEKDYSLNSITKIVTEYPEIDYGYSESGMKIEGIEGDKERTLDITIAYRLEKDEMIRQKNMVEDKVKGILDDIIESSMTDVQKEIAIHDYIVKNAEYDQIGANEEIPIPENHNPYGVLIDGKGVCESYAKAFYLLAKEAGLEVKYVTGVGKNSTGSQNHAWNMVRFDDGAWYNVDVTWDDPVVENPENKFMQVSYDYFNVPDSIMGDTHLKNKEIVNGKVVDRNVIIEYSEANGTKYTYEELDKLDMIVAEDIDGNLYDRKVNSIEELDSEIKNSIEEKKDILCLKLYDLDMNVADLSNEVNKVIADNPGMNINDIKGVKAKLIGDTIKFVKYIFSYK